MEKIPWQFWSWVDRELMPPAKEHGNPRNILRVGVTATITQFLMSLRRKEQKRRKQEGLCQS